MPNHSLIGQPAPALSLPNADGTTYEFKPGEQGKPTALFFYPKAGSYGCTREVCAFRDALTEKVEFKDSGVQVVGISGDPVPALKAFVDKHSVTYPMLSDASGEARKAYKVNRGFLGFIEGRVTFFIGSDGVVRDMYDSDMDFNGHIKLVSRALEKYGKQEVQTEAPGAEGTTNA